MINFDDVTKKFGEITALEKASFQIDKGKFAFIIGPSGSGKTTIVRLILKEYPPTSGKVMVGGLGLETLSPRETLLLRRNIGVVFQDYKLLLDQTVRENVAMALRVLGKKDEEIQERVEEALDLVGLSDRADFFPAQLAGGELQRVCLARAVVGEPKIVIADEPTGNLDPTTAWQITKLLKKINQAGKTVLMMTHNFEIVNSLQERVIELDKGRIVSDKKKGKYRIK